jgi:predicted ATPase/DNA-binding winged helix-turn-helix (wHTH) protein
MVAAVLALEHGTLDLDRRVFLGPSGEARLSTIESRLLAHLSAHPGKTFTREALQVEVWGYRAGIPSRTVFTTVGRIRQKIEADPSRPRHLLSTDGGYCFVAPEARASRSALPHPVTPFVGRDRELSQLLALLERGARLVSVLGPGGIGKTRLAIECARRFGAALGGGAAFLALEPIEHASALVRAIIEALALRPLSPREEPVAGLVERLRDREQLLLCDNVEQIEDAGALFAALSAGCPKLRVLATSRVRLSLQAETALALAPLCDPSSGAELERSDAGLLVLDRAQRARPGWTPSAAERDALAELCALAEGSPLALELATAWLRLLEPAEVVRELRAGVDLLRTSDADVPPRHTSIRAMLASSFRLLAPESERALGGLATMRAPFSRDAALAVARADLRELGQLVDASMIRRVDGGRFAFHPAVREEALTRLTPAERVGFDRAHADWFLERLTTSYREREDAPEREWRRRWSPTTSTRWRPSKARCGATSSAGSARPPSRSTATWTAATASPSWEQPGGSPSASCARSSPLPSETARSGACSRSSRARGGSTTRVTTSWPCSSRWGAKTSWWA